MRPCTSLWVSSPKGELSALVSFFTALGAASSALASLFSSPPLAFSSSMSSLAHLRVAVVVVVMVVAIMEAIMKPNDYEEDYKDGCDGDNDDDEYDDGCDG